MEKQNNKKPNIIEENIHDDEDDSEDDSEEYLQKFNS